MEEAARLQQEKEEQQKAAIQLAKDMANPALREKLVVKVHKKTIAERFADKLKNDEEKENQVMQYKENQMKQSLVGALKDNGIEVSE